MSIFRHSTVANRTKCCTLIKEKMLQTSKSIISSHNLHTTVDEKNTVLTSHCKIAVEITDQGMQILSNSALTF